MGSVVARFLTRISQDEKDDPTESIFILSLTVHYESANDLEVQ